MNPNAPKNLADTEDRHEVIQRWLRSLTPAERLEGLTLAQRLEGLSAEQILPLLPDEMLRGMSDDYLRGLSADVQQVIRQRIGRPA